MPYLLCSLSLSLFYLGVVYRNKFEMLRNYNINIEQIQSSDMKTIETLSVCLPLCLCQIYLWHQIQVLIYVIYRSYRVHCMMRIHVFYVFFKAEYSMENTALCSHCVNLTSLYDIYSYNDAKLAPNKLHCKTQKIWRHRFRPTIYISK